MRAFPPARASRAPARSAPTTSRQRSRARRRRRTDQEGAVRVGVAAALELPCRTAAEPGAGVARKPSRGRPPSGQHSPAEDLHHLAEVPLEAQLEATGRGGDLPQLRFCGKAPLEVLLEEAMAAAGQLAVPGRDLALGRDVIGSAERAAENRPLRGHPGQLLDMTEALGCGNVLEHVEA